LDGLARLPALNHANHHSSANPDLDAIATLLESAAVKLNAMHPRIKGAAVDGHDRTVTL
jgi:hypothetical protein